MLANLMMSVIAVAQPQPATPSAVHVQTLSGQAVAGTLVELTDERIVVQAGGDRRAFAPKELFALGWQVQPAATKATAWVELVDHSQLAAVDYTVAAGKARIVLASGPVAELPSKAVATVRFRQQTGPLVAQWADILKAERTGDLIVIRKNDALDYLSGVVKDVTADNVQFELDGDTLPVKRAEGRGPALPRVRDQCTARNAVPGPRLRGRPRARQERRAGRGQAPFGHARGPGTNLFALRRRSHRLFAGQLGVS